MSNAYDALAPSSPLDLAADVDVVPGLPARALRRMLPYMRSAAEGVGEQFQQAVRPLQAYVQGERMSPAEADEMVRRSAPAAALLAQTGSMPFSAPAGALRTFGGPAAKTANLAALKTAQEMEAKGWTAHTIWEDTGWFRGTDKQWRFEIPDEKARLYPVKPGQPESTLLEHQLEHPELFAAYPHLRYAQVGSLERIEPEAGAGVKGAHDPATGDLYLRSTLEPRERRSVLLHEMQHAVQKEERFSPGGSKTSPEVAHEVESELKARTALAQKTVEQGDAARDAYVEAQEASGRLADDPFRIIQFAREFWDRSPELKKRYDQAVQDLVFGHRDRESLRHQAYKRLAGEVEARNVQARAPMSPLQRSMIPPWESQDIIGSRQIVRPVEPDQPRLPGLQQLEAGEQLGRPGVISQRLVTAKGRTPEEAARYEAQRRGPPLVVGAEAMREDPQAWATTIALLRQNGLIPGVPRGVDPRVPKGVEAKLAYAMPRGWMTGDTERDAMAFMRHVKDNLLFLHDAVPQWRDRARQWYVGANKIALERAKHYGLSDEAVAGVYAALSPQKDWFANVSLGDRLLHTAMEHGNRPYTLDMAHTARRIYADPKYAAALARVERASFNQLELAADKAMWARIFDETYNYDKQWVRPDGSAIRTHQIVSPEGDFVGLRMNDPAGKSAGIPMETAWGSNGEIAKAIIAMQSQGDRYVISQAMGEANKVRSFYNNIYDPWSRYGDVTIDTHAVGGGLLLPVGGGDIPVLHNLHTNPAQGGWARLETRGAPAPAATGVAGTYGLYADAYRAAAADRDLLPREIQSITWEAIRGLFPSDNKTDALKQLVAQLWQSGAPIKDIRQQIIKAGGGIRPPDWHGK